MEEPRLDARVDVVFGGETRVFRLGIDEIVALEAECGRGYLRIYDELERRDCSIKLVGQVIRLGLEGGGVAPEEAHRLVQRYVFRPPFAEHLETALLIYGAALYLPRELRSDEGKATGDARTETADSPSPSSTATPPS